MTRIITLAAALAAFGATGAMAENDAAKGEQDFNRCKACHSIVAPDGETIVRGGRTGPNLYGIVGAPLAHDADFTRYSDAILALGEAGNVWTEDELAAYIPDAKAYLEEKSGEGNVRTAMTPQRLGDVTDVVAYLAQFGAAE